MDQRRSAGDFTPVKSARRTLQVLDLLARDPQGATFVEIQRRTGWPRSSTYNLLRTMSETGHVAFDDQQRTYRIGLRLWEAGQAFMRGHDLGRVSLPYLRAASTELNETVQLAVLDGLDNVYIAKVETDHPLKLVSEIGSRLPAYATALGKVLLAGLQLDELERRLDGVELEPFTRNTLTDTAALRAELDGVRSRGYATDDGEYTQGVVCVAVPIRDATGDTVAAMSTSVPEVRMSDRLHDRMLTMLTAQARALSSVLGWRGAPELID